MYTYGGVKEHLLLTTFKNQCMVTTVLQYVFQMTTNIHTQMVCLHGLLSISRFTFYRLCTSYSFSFLGILKSRAVPKYHHLF